MARSDEKWQAIDAVIDRIANDFEGAWRKTDKPRIDDFLEQVNQEVRPELLKELLEVERQLLDSEGREPHFDRYLSRFPDEPALRAVVEEFLTRSPDPLDIRGRGLRVCCPHCQNPVEILVDTSFKEVVCATCGSSFSLVGDSSATVSTQPENRTVGHFLLLEQLGMGAFGTVWKAKDTTLDRIVALKIPRKEQLSEDDADRFLREARTTAQLRHPNIVAVHEVGRDGDTVFIVSDYVEGLTLSDWLTGQRPSIRTAVKLTISIAEALHVAHERGVVHRDLKPSNIMLDRDDLPHVMDFGLAKRETGEITMTMSGQVLGTPAYMAPEQAQGDAHNVDRRADIYALGVILFELLTGERPFRGNQRMLLHQVLTEEAPSPRMLNSEIPRDLETITLRCLEKSANRRFSTAGDLVTELTYFLDGRPVLSRPISRLERLLRWCRRHRRVASLAAALGLSLMLVAVVGIGSALYFDAARRYAMDLNQRAENAEREAVRLATASTAEANLLQDSLASYEEVLWDAFAVQPEVDRLTSATRLRLPLDLFISKSLTTNPESSAGQIYDRVLKWKAAVTSRELLEAESGIGEKGQQLQQALDETRRQISNLVPDLGPSALESPAEVKASQLKALNMILDHRDRLQAELALQLRLSGIRDRTLSATTISAQLKQSTALIDFFVYRDLDLSELPTESVVFEERLLAFVTSGGETHCVVGPLAKDIAKEVAVWQPNRVQSPRESGPQSVLWLFWTEIEAHLQGRTKLIVVPDGDIWRYPLTALWDPLSQQFLVERFAVSYALSAQQAIGDVQPTNNVELTALVVGLSDHGPGHVKLDSAAANAASISDVIWESGDSSSWETIEISRIQDANGTEEELRAQLRRGYRIMYFAGISFSRQDALDDNPWFADVLTRAPYLGSYLQLFDPGGGDSGRFDNRMFAEEFLSLDLSRTEVCVFDSGESADGSVVSGEGLYGLARSAYLAGAKTVIGELWWTPSSVELISEFYRNLLRRGLAPVDAFRAAQLHLIKTGRPPQDWAGWVVLARGQ